jgi:ATP-binding cassette subfamily B protein
MLFCSLIISFIIDNVINLETISNPFFIWLSNLLGGIDYLRNNLYIMALLLIAINIVIALLIYIRIYVQAKVAESLAKNIKNEMFSHIQNLPFEYLSDHNSGDLIQRSTSDIETVRKFINGKIEEMFRSFITPLIAAVILFNINAKLALIAVLTLPIIFIYAFYFFKSVQKLFKLSDEADGSMSAAIQESLNGIRISKAFNNENYEIEKFNTYNKKYQNTTYKLILNLGKYFSTNTLLCYTQIFLVIVFGIMMVNSKELSYGSLFVFITYESEIVWPVRGLGRLLNDYGKTTIAINRINEILDVEEEDLKSGFTHDIIGDIEFKNIYFKYPNSNQFALKNINFKINAGDNVAIIGKTGSGKSSIVYLLEQLYTQTSGDILIDGYKIVDFNKDYLRKKIGVVLQEPFLFTRTIKENVIIANKHAAYKDVELAAKIANIHHVIKDFDNGYETMIGENGVTLSGGQKQRLAIARTIINESPILIFDDSLSAVDANTDNNIRKSLNQLNKSTTKIIITQRINSCKDADIIIVMDDGVITNIGNHNELILVEGLYKKVYDIQSDMMGGEENV